VFLEVIAAPFAVMNQEQLAELESRVQEACNRIPDNMQ